MVCVGLGFDVGFWCWLGLGVMLGCVFGWVWGVVEVLAMRSWGWGLVWGLL